MNLISCVDKNWGIGHAGELLFHYKEDMRRFKALTVGKIVVMGRKTFESLPNAAPLKNRTNIILSSSLPTNFRQDVTVCDSESQLFLLLKQFNSDDVFFIGGESIYRICVNFCKFAYITKVDDYGGADKFMPNLDELPDWNIISKNDVTTQSGRILSFLVYERN
jgi:dihydrofolate reductase